MFANNFNYNEFSKQLLIKKSCDGIFDFAMWSYHRLDMRVEVESRFINRIKDRISHLLRIVDGYADGNPNRTNIVLEIIDKTDLKGIYRSHFSSIDSDRMYGYVKCKTFCNRVKEYLTDIVYDICHTEGYDKMNCKEVDAKVYKDLRKILHEC